MSTTWLSYDELAKALGITGPSVRNLVRRKRWPRQIANDGTTRVGVDSEILEARAAINAPAASPATLPADEGTRGGTSGAADGAAVEALALVLGRQEIELARLRSELMEVPALRSQLAAAEATAKSASERLAHLEQEAAGIRADRDAARAERDSARGRADRLADELRDVLHKSLKAERARQEMASRPWWRRLVG